MTFDVLADLKWLAIVVATIAYFALGAVWYSPPVFGNAWMRVSGIQTPEGLSAGPSFYVIPFLTCLIATIAVAMFTGATGSDTLGEGIVVGLVAGLGIAATVLLVSGYFDQQKSEPLVWVAILSGYHLLGLTLAAAIVAIWN